MGRGFSRFDGAWIYTSNIYFTAFIPAETLESLRLMVAMRP